MRSIQALSLIWASGQSVPQPHAVQSQSSVYSSQRVHTITKTSLLLRIVCQYEKKGEEKNIYIYSHTSTNGGGPQSNTYQPANLGVTSLRSDTALHLHIHIYIYIYISYPPEPLGESPIDATQPGNCCLRKRCHLFLLHCP